MAERLTIKKIAEAIRKDGKKQTQRTLWRDKASLSITGGIPSWDVVDSACALGMASLNLGVHPDTIADFVWAKIQLSIVDLNDGKLLTFEQIADTLIEREKSVNAEARRIRRMHNA